MRTKNLITVIALIAVCAVATGCGYVANAKGLDANGAKTPPAKTAPGEPQVLVDKTVEPEDAYGPPSADKKIMRGGGVLCTAINPGIDNISALSDAVIRGIVKKVSYVGIKGVAWTVTSVLVTDVYKGGLNKGDLISVYQLGGYIPLAEEIKADEEEFRYKDWSKSDIENTVIEEQYDGEKFPEKGEDCLYFLINNERSVYPDGAYVRTAVKDAKLDVVTEDGKILFERDKPDAPSGSNVKERFSIDDIKKSIEKDECLEINARWKK
jgi:hypothetical protein